MRRLELLALPVPPTANLYWRNWRGRMVVSPEARAYKLKLGWLAKSQAKAVRLEGRLAVSITLRRKHRRGDADNFLKVALDALKGVLFDDDSQIEKLSIELKHGESPGMDVTLEEMKGNSDANRRA